MPRLFGTDGIRGHYGTDFDAPFVRRLGRAAAEVLGRGHPSPRILIGRDTRASGPEIERALAKGIAAANGVPVLAGVIPTAAIAHLVHSGGYEAGAVISASHNPAQDNGIKFFGDNGMKLADAIEDEIEASMGRNGDDANGDEAGWERLPDAAERYITFLLDGATSLAGMKIVVDAANGAASAIAAEAYRRAGAIVISLYDEPDGANINDGCGAVHPEALQSAVLERGGQAGIAHDGDADRLVAVDERGALVDGDQILAICALDARRRGALPGDAIVTTVMANLGFRRAMAAEGISVSETPVGDRYVLERMLAEGIAMGGEQSGHLIFLDRHTTGCGILSAMRLLGIMAATAMPLSRLAASAPRLPQVLLNVRVATRGGLSDAAAVWDEVRRVTEEMGEDGRVLVRESGTEPVVRVMVESSRQDRAAAAAERIAKAVTDALG
ncbi:MAG TPA: phosphoglucosamine mutase [Actinomycetota bacterium]